MIPLVAALALLQASPATSAACRATPSSDQTIVAHDRACYEMGPTREFSGIWIDEFEGQRFVENAKTLSDAARSTQAVWIDIDRPLTGAVVRAAGVPAARTDIYRPHAYLVRFSGARAATRSGKDSYGWPNGYGHMGMSSDLIVVDRFESIVDLGVPPSSDNPR